MALGKHTCEDHVVNFKEWQTLKPTMGFFGTLPVVENAEGRKMTQARALVRMFGKMVRGIFPPREPPPSETQSACSPDACSPHILLLPIMPKKKTVIDDKKMYPDEIMDAFSCDEIMVSHLRLFLPFLSPSI
jgi:hypothetical protein